MMYRTRFMSSLCKPKVGKMIYTSEVSFQLTDYRDERRETASDVRSTLQKKGKAIPNQSTLVINVTMVIWNAVVVIW